MFTKLPTMRTSPRTGLTLIEVMTGLLMLSTLLVGLLMTAKRHASQIHRAHRSIEAAQAADSLLVEWFEGEEELPLSESGRVSVDGSLHWELQTLARSTGSPFDLRVARLEIRESLPIDEDEPLLTVDIALPPTLSDQQAIEATNVQDRTPDIAGP